MRARPPRSSSPPAAAASTSRSRWRPSRRRRPRAGAEIVVVEDDPADPETERARGRGTAARYVAHGRAARASTSRATPAIARRVGELLCFLDDDVEVWPGWLRGAARGAARAPRRTRPSAARSAPRLEGGRLHACGREPLPVTTLDLGAQDRDAEFVWGANLALRRERARADRAASTPRSAARATRRTGSGGCAPPAGASATSPRAGVDHRRAGADARLRALVARGLPPRPRLAPLRRLQGRGAAAGGRAAHARGLRLAHRPPPLRQRDRAHRADARAACARRSRPGRAPPAPGRRRTTPRGRSGTLVAPHRRHRRPARRRAPTSRACPRALALRRGRAHGRRAGACSSLGVARPEHARTVARAAARAAPLPPRRRRSRLTAPAPGARQVGEPQRAARRAPGRRATTGCCSSTTTCVLPRGFLDAFLLVRRALRARGSPSPRTRSPRTPPGTVTRRRPGPARAHAAASWRSGR